jgi:hypothetical protein
VAAGIPVYVITAKARLDVARGMVAETASSTVGEAARLLTDFASRRHVRLAETAYTLVTRAMEPAVVGPSPQS